MIKRGIWWQFSQASLKIVPENKRDINLLYGVIGKKTSDTKLLSEREILADSLLPSHIQNVSGGTGRAQPPSTRPFWYKRTVCLAQNYLNSSILLPVMEFDVSVGLRRGRRGEDAVGELCCMVSGMAAREMCPRAGWVTWQRAALLHCCLKGKHSKSCFLCGSRTTTVWWEREGNASSGARHQMHIRAFLLAAMQPTWDKSHRESLAGVKPAGCSRNYSLLSFKF